MKIYIDVINGKVSILSDGSTLKNQKRFNLEQIESVESIGPLLISTKKEVGELSPRILSWGLYFDNESQRLTYSIDVTTTMSDKVIYRNTNK